ncbi:MAG: hypothetical protein R2939_21870 [Kofleriaceae bacterium]
MVPPPGVNVPPPPGTQPARPAVPNAADDPFGAMNAMAQMGQVQRAPEIVIVNDGKPVEQVGASTRFATIGKYALIALVPMVIGMVMGAAGRSNSAYNQAIGGAKVIAAGVKASKQSLGELQTVLDEATKKGPLKPDKALTDSLKPLVERLKPPSDVVFRASKARSTPICPRGS